MQTLDRFKQRLDTVNAALTASEIEDVVTVRDVVTVLQRAEMVLRVGEEIAELLDELGEHGRLLRLQLDELVLGVADDRRLVVEDYLEAGRVATADEVLVRIGALSTAELLGLDDVVLALTGGELAPVDLDGALAPRGRRVLARIPNLPPELADRVIESFGDLQGLVRVPAAELAAVSGISEAHAQLVKDGLAHLAESSILDRYN
jgi:diadenylate cyclase